jgi:hypothetical protein
MDYLYIQRDNKIGLFTLTNNNINKEDILKTIRGFMVVTILPITARWFFPGSFKDNYVDDTQGHRDYLYDVNRLRKELPSHIGFSVRDAIALFSMMENGFMHPKSIYMSSGNLTSQMAMGWVVLIRKDIIRKSGHYTTMQTWMMGNTNYAKILTPILRTVYNLSGDSLHVIRRLAILEMFPDAKLIKDSRIDGQVVINNKVTSIAVAGHLINMLLAASVFWVDVLYYMKTIKRNFQNTQRNDFSGEKSMLDKNLNLEKVHLGLWHTVLEYKLAIRSFEILSKVLKIPKAFRYTDLVKDYIDTNFGIYEHMDISSTALKRDKVVGSKYNYIDASIVSLQNEVNDMFKRGEPRMNIDLF